jgi:hypothetical protein
METLGHGQERILQLEIGGESLHRESGSMPFLFGYTVMIPLAMFQSGGTSITLSCSPLLVCHSQKYIKNTTSISSVHQM